MYSFKIPLSFTISLQVLPALLAGCPVVFAVSGIVCEVIKKIDNWVIELILENNLVEETNYPDWFGYKKIDKI